MSDLFVGQRLTGIIENLSYGGGRGILRHQGFVLFIPFVLPGEKVCIEIKKLKKSYGEASLLEVLQASSERMAAPCPYFIQCGGCVWQHITYEEQLRIKQQIFRSFLKEFTEVQFLTAIPSENIYHYRNRIQLHKKGNKFGYHRRSSQNLIAIDQCLIAEKAINSYLEQLQNLKDGRYEVYIDSVNQVKHRTQHDLAEGQLFAQVNTTQNKELIARCIAWLNELDSKILLELFCGSGNFTYPIAKAFPSMEIIAIDGSTKLIEFAKNKSVNDKITFYSQNLRNRVRSKFLQNKRVDIILLDPPREGCSQELLEDLAQLKPHHIIYISCNPSTLARDLKILKTLRYRPIKSQIFDMFPQTDHIESMTYITRI